VARTQVHLKLSAAVAHPKHLQELAVVEAAEVFVSQVPEKRSCRRCPCSRPVVAVTAAVVDFAPAISHLKGQYSAEVRLLAEEAER
jgi:hypothetical protein